MMKKELLTCCRTDAELEQMRLDEASGDHRARHRIQSNLTREKTGWRCSTCGKFHPMVEVHYNGVELDRKSLSKPLGRRLKYKKWTRLFRGDHYYATQKKSLLRFDIDSSGTGVLTDEIPIMGDVEYFTVSGDDRLAATETFGKTAAVIDAVTKETIAKRRKLEGGNNFRFFDRDHLIYFKHNTGIFLWNFREDRETCLWTPPESWRNPQNRLVVCCFHVLEPEKGTLVYQLTAGVVDAASAALFDIWGFGFKNGDMPDDERVSEVLASCGFKCMSRDIRSVYGSEGVVGPCDLLKDAYGEPVKLNYNALAQGYSCDKVAEYLYSIGVKDMMVDIGEIFCDGVNPSGKPWGIGIDRPVDGNNSPGADLQAVFRVPEGPHGVVTSGNYRKFYVKDGKKYAHTIDPRSGYPVTHNLLSATILASDGFTADAYATYCMVVGLEEAVRFIESTPEIEGCLVYDEGGEFKAWTSSGMTLSDL